MTVECSNPDDLPPASTYSHVAVATGTRLVFVAGQVAEDSAGDLVGGDDISLQARQAFENVKRALAAVGARPEDVAKITIYVVGYQSAFIPLIERARQAVFGDHKPADALIGVATLAMPEWLIEIEAVAVLDDDG